MYEYMMISGYQTAEQIAIFYIDGWRLIGLVAHPDYEREYHFERPLAQLESNS